MASDFEVFLFLLALAGLVLGGLGIWLARAGRAEGQVSWGRRLYVLTLLTLGVSAFVAAVQRAEGLTLLGFAAGSLVIAMLWEGPRSEQVAPEPVSDYS